MLLRRYGARIGPCLLLSVLLLLPSVASAQGPVSPAAASNPERDAEVAALDSLLSLPIHTALRDQPAQAASKFSEIAREAPASVTVITAEDIERHGYRTLDEVLAAVRGFYISYDRNYTFVGVRGFGRPSDYNNRLLVLIDGHTTNEYVGGSTTVGSDLGLDLSAIERIEVVRGPGSALYGSSAMFAVVNLVPKRADVVDGLRVEGRLGSYGRREGTALVGHTFDGGPALVLSGLWSVTDGADLYFPEFDAPETNAGVAEDLDWDRVHGLLGTLTHGDLTLLTRYSARTKGVPTGAWEVPFNHPDFWTYDRQAFAELRLDRALTPAHRLLLRGYVDHFDYEGSYPYEEEDETFDSFDAMKNDRAGAEARLQWDTAPSNRLVLGLEAQRHVRASYRLWDEYETYSAFDEPFTVAAAYAQNAYQLRPDLALTLGLRYDWTEGVASALSPRGALVYTPSARTSVKLLYGEAFRAPSAYERLYDDLFAGFKPNPDLGPERIRTAEIAWEQQLTPVLTGLLAVYDYTVTDLIDPTEDPADALTHFQNVGRVRARGIEAELSLDLPSGSRGYASYAYQHARDGADDAPLSNSPAHLAKAGLSVPVPVPGVGRLWAAADARYESGRRTVYETQTDGYAYVRLALTTDPLAQRLRLGLVVRNLLDTAYSLPGGLEHVQPALRQDGRTITVTLSYAL